MADITFEQVRQKYPQYKDLSDDQLAEGLHKKYYPDMPFEQFSTKIGYKSNAKTEPDTTYQKMASQGAVDPYSGQYIPGFSQSEINRTFSESGKGVISGIAQTATGLGELLPGEVGKKSAQATKELRKFGYGPSQLLGSLLVPAAGATKAPILAGALSGALTPTGEEDTLKRYGEKGIAAILGATPGILGKAVGYGSKFLGTAKGKEAVSAAEELRGTIKGLTETEIAAQKEVAEKATSELERIMAAQRQIAERDAIAADRAARQAGTPPETMADIRAARQAGTPPETMADIRAKTLKRTRERVADAEKAAREAGLNEAETISHVADVEGRVAQAEDAVQKLEQRLASGETITPEGFGSIIRDTAEKIRTKGVETREKLAGFGKAISSAGERPIVNTSNIIKRIDRILKNERDEGIKNTLNILKRQLTTTVRNKDVAGLNIASTDSLRKAMDRILSTKTIQMANGVAGDAASAVHHVAELKDLLVNAAKKAHAPYREALQNYAKLSRPLDIVSRKGPLRAVLDVDALSQDFLRGSAEVAGRVIQRAKEGHPVFTRLVAENPEIVNGARAFFNRELFGGGRVPNADILRSFLQKNEGVLKQLGIYKEFETVASARASGQRALDIAKAELTQAKAAQKGATTATREAERAITGETILRGLASSRVAQAEKATVTPKKIAEERALRAKDAEIRLAKDAKAPTEAKATAEARADVLRKSGEELDLLSPEQVSSKARTIASDLRAKGAISGAEYTDMLQKIDMIDKAYGKTKDAQKLIKTLFYSGVGVVAGEEAWRRTFGGK